MYTYFHKIVSGKENKNLCKSVMIVAMKKYRNEFLYLQNYYFFDICSAINKAL